MLPLCNRQIRIARTKYLSTRNRGIPVPREPTTLGGHLRRRRLQLGLHQSQAAQKLGVSMTVLSKWEWDKMKPKRSRYPRIIAYLGFDPFQKARKSTPPSA